MAQQKITISTEFLATVKGMDDVVRQMQTGLAKADPVKASGFNKMVNKMTDEYKNFLNLTKSGQVDLFNAKDVEKSSKKIIDLFRQITDKYGEISSMSTSDLKKFFPDAFNKNVEEATKLVSNFTETIKKIGEAEDKYDNLFEKIKELRQIAEDAGKKVQSLLGSYKDSDELRKAVENAKNSMNQTKEAAKEAETALRGAFEGTRSDAAVKSASELAKLGKSGATAWSDYRAANIKAVAALKNANATEETNLKTLEEKKAVLEDIQLKLRSSDMSSKSKAESVASNKDAVMFDGTNITTLGQLDSYLAKIRTAIAAVKNEVTALNNAQSSGFTEEQAIKASSAADSYTKQAKAARDAKVAYRELNGTLKEVEKTEKEGSAAVKEGGVAKLELKAIEQELNRLKESQISLDQLLQKLKDLGIISKDATLEAIGGLEGIENVLANMDEESAKKLKDALEQTGIAAKDAGRMIEEGFRGSNGLKESRKDAERLNSELETMKNRVKTFFGLANSVRIFQKAVRSSFNTIKELDKTMVETAVVTEFDVGDMWDQLPEYTRRAKELGVSINDTYKAATLYYQQGLEEKI